MGKVARKFLETRNYAVGDLVLYKGELFVFTSAHSASAWDGDDAKRYDDSTMNKIMEIISVYDDTVAAAEFAESVVFEPYLVGGTRYGYKLTNAQA